MHSKVVEFKGANCVTVGCSGPSPYLRLVYLIVFASVHLEIRTLKMFIWEYKIYSDLKKKNGINFEHRNPFTSK